MNISSLIGTVTSALDKVRIPLKPIPGLFLACTCARRPGLSTVVTSSKVYSEMDDNEYDDIVKKFVYNVLDHLKQNLHDDGVCLIVLPPQSLSLQLTGGNALGPAVLNGSNVNFALVWGIIR